ncbi:hypothetical protein GCM10009751_21500 [Myceligenerans crystallogenes]|uniref:Type VII secretion system protein EssD-like domain-containing protein n=2 Tax=Myceligenerans crystallogenes TaxID=316335 RepID=A0ABN2NG08_9MICO
MYGADVTALRTLADQIDRGSELLDGTVTTVEAAMPDPFAWNGPDAEGFRTAWEGGHAARLRATAAVLGEVAARVRANADAQQATSEDLSGTGGSGGFPRETSPAAEGAAELRFRPVAFVAGRQDPGAGAGAAADTADMAGTGTAAEQYPPPDVERTVRVDEPPERTAFGASTGLEPNTAYEVTDRGTFYTDGSGRVVHVETGYGRTGDLNHDLIEPQPDATYVVGDDHVFRTDGQGRTVEAHATDLGFGEADRSSSIQQRIGDQGGDGYDGGHLIGNQFGGGPEDINLVPMLEEINRGSGDTFYATEMRLREALEGDPPSDVELHVYPGYGDDGPVPSTIAVEYSIDGESERKEFDND